MKRNGMWPTKGTIAAVLQGGCKDGAREKIDARRK